MEQQIIPGREPEEPEVLEPEEPVKETEIPYPNPGLEEEDDDIKEKEKKPEEIKEKRQIIKPGHRVIKKKLSHAAGKDGSN